MEFKRKFGKQKESKPKKGLFLVIILIIVVLLWYNAEVILKTFF
jgi:flagellar basal body-associated protein FliL